VLLDECLPQRLGRELTGHEVRTVQQVGWAGVSNGELLRRAAADFDVFVTVDRNLTFQQSLSNLEVAVVVLVAVSNDIDALRPLMPRVMQALVTLRKGEVIRVGG
jgi:predicted nuclease of predicted toxin-antitoxin system